MNTCSCVAAAALYTVPLLLYILQYFKRPLLTCFLYEAQTSTVICCPRIDMCPSLQINPIYPHTPPLMAHMDAYVYRLLGTTLQ